jgi:hypothetical protein
MAHLDVKKVAGSLTPAKTADRAKAAGARRG